MENELYTISDLMETKTNRFNIVCKETGFYEYVEIKYFNSLEPFNYNFYYSSNKIDEHDQFTLMYGDNYFNYLEYLHDWDNNNNLALGNEDYITTLGLVNPLLLLKLIDNEETIKKLLKLETVIIDCVICKLEITPVTQ